MTMNMGTTFLNASWSKNGHPSSTGGYEVDSNSTNQKGFSIMELLIAMSMMAVITIAVMSLVKSSMMISTTTYELTEAQENLRIAHEYITRDLMNAGDGLKSIQSIPVNKAFVQNYLTLNPVLPRQADGVTPDTTATVINLGILTTDNNVPDLTWVALPGASPSPTPVKVK